MLFYNIPKDIIFKNWFKRPEVVYAYLCIYSHASKSAHTYTHIDQSTWLEMGECVITQSFGPEVMPHGKRSETMSWIRTLLDSGYIIKKKVENFTETVYQVPAILNPEPGNYVRIALPDKIDLHRLWEKCKYLISTYVFMAVEAVSRDKDYNPIIRRWVERANLATTYARICKYCGCTKDIARSIIDSLEEMKYIVRQALKGVGLMIKMMFYPKKTEKPKTEQVNSTNRVEAAPAQEQPRTLAPSPIIEQPPVQNVPSDPIDPIEEGVRHYLYDLKKVKSFDPSLFVLKLRDIFNQQGYDATLLTRCLDELRDSTDFISKFPDPDALSKIVDAWYHDHSGLEQSSGTNGAATEAPENEKQAKALLDKIWSEMGRSRYEYIFTKHVSCRITADLVIISDLQTSCQRIIDNSYAQEAIAKSVNAILGPSMKFEVIPL